MRDALAHSPDDRRGTALTRQQAKGTLARLLLLDGSLAEARSIATDLARSTDDPRGLGVISMLLGQLDAIDSPRHAEGRFRTALAKFRAVGDRRSQAWASKNLAETLIRQRKPAGEARRLVRESLSTCSRIGESTQEYLEWLQRTQAAYVSDAAMLALIDHEIKRVSRDLSLSLSGRA